MVDDEDTVYLGKIMPSDPDEPVYAERIGTTVEAVQDALMEALATEDPPAVTNFEWDGMRGQDSIGNWTAVIKRKVLMTESFDGEHL